MSRRRPFSGLLVSTFVLCIASLGVTCDFGDLAITPETLPNGAVDAAYSQNLTAGGSNDGIWDVSGGLPPGLSLNSDTGKISGQPTAEGDYQFTVSVDRFLGGSGERTYSLTIHPRLEVSLSLAIARQDEAYEDAVDVSGGVPPYSFSFVGLPAGLSGDADTGEITGTPIQPEDGRIIEVTVTDSGSPSQSKSDQATLFIKPRAVSITTTALDPGRVTVPYEVEIEVIDGLEPYTFAITDGTLPPGLSLPDDLDSGVISGTPTQDGVFEFTITVTDADDPSSSDSLEFTITIAP